MKQKICFFAPFFSLVGQRMLEYYETVLTPHAEVFLFCKNSDIEKFKLKKIKKAGYSSNKIMVYRELRKFCRENNIDVLTNLARRAKVASIMAAATLFTKTQIVFYDHGNPSKSEIIGVWLLQLFLDKVLTCSEDVADKYRKFLQIKKEKITCLYTSIDTNFFKPQENNNFRKRLNIGKNEKVIIYVGRIQYMKGSDYLLKIIDKNPDKKFILIGELMDENYNPSSLKNVIFIDYANLEKLFWLYNCADLCVFLSRSEGLSVGLREIMACGIPAIISDIEGQRALKPAIKVPFDENIIQQEINKFFKLSKKQRKSISKETAKYIVKNFSFESLKNKTKECFLH